MRILLCKNFDIIFRKGGRKVAYILPQHQQYEKFHVTGLGVDDLLSYPQDKLGISSMLQALSTLAPSIWSTIDTLFLPPANSYNPNFLAITTRTVYNHTLAHSSPLIRSKAHQEQALRLRSL